MIPAVLLRRWLFYHFPKCRQARAPWVRDMERPVATSAAQASRALIGHAKSRARSRSSTTTAGPYTSAPRTSPVRPFASPNGAHHVEARALATGERKFAGAGL